MMEEERSTDLTEVLLRLKRAFEDKNVDAFRQLFRPNPKVNVDGKFYSLAQLLETLKALFDAVDQTYFDIIATKKVEGDNETTFGTFDVEVAWVDRRDWLEHVQKLDLSLEVVRDAKTRVALINGLSSVSRPPAKPTDQAQDSGFPDDVGTSVSGLHAPAGDPWNIWY